MKISRSKLKEIVKDTVIENNEYEKFFKSALAKSGKAIPDMSDEEKVSFFDKVDGAWNAKGEKREIGEQECEECNESVNEAKAPKGMKAKNGIQVDEVEVVNGKSQWVGFVRLDDQQKIIPAVQGSTKVSVTARANKLMTGFKENVKTNKEIQKLESKIKSLKGRTPATVGSISAIRDDINRLKKKLNEGMITEATFTNQTGIKSSITRSNEFKKAVGDMKRIRWAMSDGVKIFNWAGHGLIFTDGKFEMIVDPKKPMQVVGEFGKARNEFKSLVNNKNESMNNLDWGKSTAERNANLDKHKSLKTDKEKDAFLKKLKGESINEAGGYDVTIKQYNKGQFKGHFSLSFNSSKAKAHAKQRGVTGVDGRGDPMLAGKLKDLDKYKKILKQRGFSIDTYIMESSSINEFDDDSIKKYGNAMKTALGADERGSKIWIKVQGRNGEYYNWFLQKIDSSHFKMANSEKVLKTNRAYDSHIDQHKQESYYNDVKKWLNGKIEAPKLNGKKYKGLY